MLTDGRTPDAGVTGILIAHLGAFGSGELKMRVMENPAPILCTLGIIELLGHSKGGNFNIHI